jgi:pyruvate kinase
MAILTSSGQSALLVSKCRPKSRVIAITSSQETYHQLSLKWGVEAVYFPQMETHLSQTTVFDVIGQHLQQLKIAKSGDKIVITAGLPKLEHGSTNTIKIHQVS